MVLAIFTPGLGQAVVSNIWLGVGSFLIYMLLLLPKITTEGNPYLGEFLTFIYRFAIVWGAFMVRDWRLVNREMKKHLVNDESEALLETQESAPNPA